MKFYVAGLLLVHAFVCTMAVNDVLVTKWKDWYKFVDVNHDGSVSVADFKEARDNFTQLHDLDDNKLEKLLNKFDEWWNVYILKGQTDMPEEQFVDDLSREYTANKTDFYNKMQQCVSLIFDVFDTDEDGSISLAEFLIGCKGHGHDNVPEEVKLFIAYGPKDGLVPVKDMVDSWVDFTTSEDSSKPSVVKDEL